MYLSNCYYSCNFLFRFIKTFHQTFVEESPHSESRIKSNRIRSHWIWKKLFETFSRGAISRTSSENLSSSLYTCLVYAAISRAYGAYFSLLLPRPARGKRGRIERWRKRRFFYALLEINEYSTATFPPVQFVRNGYPRFTLHRVIAVYFSSMYK